MIECLNTLVGLRQLCGSPSTEPIFFLDDIEGVNVDTIAQLATATQPSGKAFANSVIESQSRMLIADIESIVPKGYSIKSQINAFCNICSYTNVTNMTAKTGVIVKNISPSKNTQLAIDSIKVQLQTSGNFTIVLDDGVAPVQIPTRAFTAGTEVIVTNIQYKTSQKNVKIYINEGGAAIPVLSCTTINKGCGCSGGSNQMNKDIQIKGLFNNIENTNQYGFIPCASILCSLDNIMCQLINQQPRLYALALLYRSASRIYSEAAVTERNNLFASFSKEKKGELATYYMQLYNERLRGSSNVKGISDNLAQALNNLHDECVDCQRGTRIVYATG